MRDTEPTAEVELGWQSVHTAEPSASAYVLTAHIVHAVAAASENFPMGHWMSVVLFGQKLPGLHTRHDRAPVLTYPTMHPSHAVSTDDSGGAVVYCGHGVMELLLQ